MMASAKFKIDTKKLEKNLNKALENKVEHEGGKMRVLNDTEKELLKILISKLKNNYICTLTYDILPKYIESQLKDLLQILKYSGYCANFNLWLDGIMVTLTPECIF